MSLWSQIKRAWSGFGHAARAYSLYTVLQWLLGLGVSSTVTPYLASLSSLMSGMSSGLRLIFFIGLGLLILAVMLALTQWLRFRFKLSWLTEPAVPPTSAEAEALREKLTQAEASLSHLQGEHDRFEAENCRMRDIFAENEAQRDRALAERARWYHMQHYGEELLLLSPLNLEDLGQVLSKVDELKPSLRDTIAGADQVWAHLSAQIKWHSGELPWKILAWRIDRLEDTERRHVTQVENALEKALQNREDPRPFLAATYTRYRKWRDQVADVAKVFGQPVGPIPGCIPWMAAERRFLAELQETLLMPALEPVRRVVTTYDREKGQPEDFSQT